MNATGKAAIKAYIDDTTVAYATEAGSEYIAEQICDALSIIPVDNPDDPSDPDDPIVPPATCTHKDDNHDHICDNNCGKTDIGECSDSATDDNHVCDYGEGYETGCQKVLEAHVDENKDHKCDNGCPEKIGAHEDVEPVDHMCDYCGQRMSTHKYGKWETTKEATKTEEGEKVRICTICGHRDIATIPCLEGLSTGAIIAIVIACILVVGGIGFAIYWFGYKKQMLFKKKATKTLSGK